MTTLWGNDNGGGGSGSNGHRVIVDYNYTQNILGNYTDLNWSYGVDYGDPNYWNNISFRNIAWTLTAGSSVSGVSGSGAGTSDGSTINTSNPGYGGQIHYFWSGTVRIYHDSSGVGTIHLLAQMSFSSGSYTSTINQDISLPNIPQNPAAPSAVTATRVNDTQATVAWTNNSTGTAPYASIKVYRATDGGSYALIANPGVVTSYSDTTITANHKYQYKVSAVGTNTAESSQTAAAAGVFTTPGAPSTLAATKLAGGDIRLTWANNANYTEHTIRIEESQNGGAYSEIANVASGTTTWDHVAPSTAVTHKYRIRARSTTGSLNSSYSNESATITLLSTAGAPSGLAPSGIAKDATEAIVFTWTHNPTDATPQTKYQLQWSTNGGSTWTTVGPTTTSVSSYTMPASTTTNGQTITWRVATAGQNGTIGSYSANASFTTSARPTSTISFPSGGTFNLSHLTATWTYFQAQSSAQAAWHAYLYRVDAGPTYVLLEEQTGSGTGTSVTLATTLLDGVTYAIKVVVTSAAGLDSSAAGTDLETFTVGYLPPADLTLTAVYNWDSGSVTVTATGTGPVGGVSEAIATVDLQRRINGGDWVTWASGIVLPVSDLTANVLDTAPIVNGTNEYRALVKSATPSSAFTTPISVPVAETSWGFLSTGPGFSQVVRMRAMLSLQATVGRDKATYEFAGREDPVELSGEAVGRKYAVSAILFGPSSGGLSSEPEDLEELATTDMIVLWRDYRGKRFFASLSDVSINYEPQANKYPASFTLTKVGYNENVG